MLNLTIGSWYFTVHCDMHDTYRNYMGLMRDLTTLIKSLILNTLVLMLSNFIMSINPLLRFHKSAARAYTMLIYHFYLGVFFGVLGIFM